MWSEAKSSIMPTGIQDALSEKGALIEIVPHP
jgi:hypothetical protein